MIRIGCLFGKHVIDSDRSSKVTREGSVYYLNEDETKTGTELHRVVTSIEATCKHCNKSFEKTISVEDTPIGI